MHISRYRCGIDYFEFRNIHFRDVENANNDLKLIVSLGYTTNRK